MNRIILMSAFLSFLSSFSVLSFAGKKNIMFSINSETLNNVHSFCDRSPSNCRSCGGYWDDADTLFGSVCVLPDA